MGVISAFRRVLTLLNHKGATPKSAFDLSFVNPGKSIKTTLMTLTTLLGVSQVDAQTIKKCHALALSSVDEAAAYQVGSLRGIVSSLEFNATDWAFDSVSGVSGGALNTVRVASFKKGDDVIVVDRMEQF